MTTKRLSTELRQIELVDAALHLVATRGIAALSTRSLAEEVGLTSGALFRHFGSLDELLDAVVARVQSVLDATYPPGGLPPRERLVRFAEARSGAVGAQVGVLRLVLSDQFRLALPRRGSARLGACVEKTRGFLVRALRDGQADGTIRDDVDPESLALVVMGTIQMKALSISGLPGSASPAADVGATLATLLSPAGRARGTPDPAPSGKKER